ncbi:MAG TPA: hypothetical protein VNQ33_05965 [Acidimicrobiales bacterium]|nr:hypothetical protein [Acidimicrobiales bacterium]
MVRPSLARWSAAVSFLALGSALAACSNPSESTVSADAVPTTIDIADNPNGGSFRLLTYNVQGLPVEISEGRPDLNLPSISPLLNDYDLVLTQEDYDWWKPEGLASGFDFVNYHGRLRAKATHEYQSPQHPGPEAVGVDLAERPDLELGDGLGILANVDVEGDERVPWTGCFGGFSQDDGGKADCLAMKGFQVTTLTLANGAPVHVYNLNAESGTNPKDQQLQAADFEQLAEHIAHHAQGKAVIVAGHTNLALDDADPASGRGQDRRIWEHFLEQAGLTDACEAGTCDDAVIDRVVYRSGGGVELSASSQVDRSDRFVDDAGEPLSGFPPLEVAFDWRPEGSS